MSTSVPIGPLEPYLRELCESWSALPARDEEETQSLVLGRLGVELDPWEGAAIDRYLLKAEEDVSRLVAQSLALTIKSFNDMARLERHAKTTTDCAYGLQAELMLDTAIGRSLVKETQSTIDELLKSGEIEEAQHLSQFHHRLRNMTFKVRQVLSDSEKRQADRIVESLGRSPELDLSAAARDALSGALDWTGRPKPTDETAEDDPELLDFVEPPDSSRTFILAALVLASVLIRLAVVELPQHVTQRPRTLTTAALGAVEAFTKVDDRRPSLYVTVDAAAWAGLAPSERKELISGVSHEVSPRGYAGALFVTGERRPVAQWIKTDGVRLIESVEEQSQP